MSVIEAEGKAFARWRAVEVPKIPAPTITYDSCVLAGDMAGLREGKTPFAMLAKDWNKAAI